MIGEIGALGGSIIPTVLSYSKQHFGSYRNGWIMYAGIAFLVLIMLRVVSRSWTKTWVGPGGRALPSSRVTAPMGDILVSAEGATFAAD